MEFEENKSTELQKQIAADAKVVMSKMQFGLGEIFGTVTKSAAQAGEAMKKSAADLSENQTYKDTKSSVGEGLSKGWNFTMLGAKKTAEYTGEKLQPVK